jgi:hypothetical protein
MSRRRGSGPGFIGRRNGGPASVPIRPACQRKGDGARSVQGGRVTLAGLRRRDLPAPAHVRTEVLPPGSNSVRRRKRPMGRAIRSAGPGLSPTANAMIFHAELGRLSMMSSPHHTDRSHLSRDLVTGSLTDGRRPAFRSGVRLSIARRRGYTGRRETARNRAVRFSQERVISVEIAEPCDGAHPTRCCADRRARTGCHRRRNDQLVRDFAFPRQEGGFSRRCAGQTARSAETGMAR